ncbi:MAG TPA: hypothetical protein PLU30_17970 [Verrucomicrobiae bacterium]|nr:hypothetical protein [Verrucomicrobiae bacterium]
MAAKVITAANVLAGSNGKKKDIIFGEAVTAGMPLYRKAADGRYYKADANSATAYAAEGIALNGGAAGQPGFLVYDDDDFTPGCALSVGEILVVGADAAGDIAPSTDLAEGWYPTILGVAKSATKMVLKPVAAGVAIPAA